MHRAVVVVVLHIGCSGVVRPTPLPALATSTVPASAVAAHEGADPAPASAAPPKRDMAAEAERACDEGNAQACLDRGRLDRATEPVWAASFLRRACDAGLVDGCSDLASIAHDLEADCEANDARCNAWGVLLAEGLGVAKDEKRAFAAYERSCAAHVARACDNAARLYRSGVGAERDEAKAKVRFEAACQLGVHRACAEVPDVLPMWNYHKWPRRP